jgi:hypothetical protein
MDTRSNVFWSKSLEYIEVNLFVKVGDYDYMCLIWSFNWGLTLASVAP